MRTPITSGYAVAGVTARKTYGASPRSVGVMPMSRTTPTISNHGSGFGRISTGVTDATADRARAIHVLPRERFVHEHASAHRRPIAIVEVAAGDQRDLERLEESRADGVDPQIGDLDRCASPASPPPRPGAPPAPMPGSRSPNVTATHTGLLRDPPLELRVGLLDPRRGGRRVGFVTGG